MLLPSFRLHYDPSLHRALFKDTELVVPDLDVDVLASIVADPADAANALLESYRQRAPADVNEELESRIRAILHLLRFRMDDIPSDLERERVLRVVEEHRVIPLLLEVLSDKAFFEENLSFVIDILNMVYHVFAIAHHASLPLDPYFAALASGFCDSLLQQRAWFEDVRNRLAGTSHHEEANLRIRKALLPNMLLLLSEGPFLQTHGLRQACLLCWITSPSLEDPEHVTPILALALLQYVLAGPDDQYPTHRELQDAFRAAFDQYIIPSYGAALYLQQAAKMLRNQDSLGDDILELILPVITLSILCHPMLLTDPALSDVLIAMHDLFIHPAIQAVHRRERRVAFEFLNICMRLIPSAQNGPEYRPSLTTITRNGRLFEVLSRVLCIFVTDPSMTSTASAASDYRHCLEYLNTVGAWALVVNTKRTRNATRRDMRSVLQRSWSPTLRLLHDTLRQSRCTDEHDRLIQGWTALGDALGLDKGEFEANHRKPEHCCAWRRCRHHYEPSAERLKACKGCGEVRYCGRTCQRLHWDDNHRRECKRIGWSGPE
ncbi:unnamed protein product [Peniophora sp. CBMAI 1063]|nr:unnamed protein product [Peniophora sp. CBMAI 1063]